MKRTFSFAVVATMLIAGSLVFTSASARAAGPYIPPNPGPVHVEAGVFQPGQFPLPGLYLGPTSPGESPHVNLDLSLVDLIADGMPPTTDPIVWPPGVNGEPDSSIGLALKDHDLNNVFVGIATFRVELCGRNSETNALVVCHTYDFVLYVGVDLPVVEEAVTGAATGPLVATGAATLLLGGGMIVLSRRRRLVPVRVR